MIDDEEKTRRNREVYHVFALEVAFVDSSEPALAY